MIKVSELKKRGIEIVAGDTFEGGVVTMSNINMVRNHTIFGDSIITAFAPRKNTGNAPVKLGVTVMMILEDGDIMRDLSEDVEWDCTNTYPQWMPSMRHLIEDVECESEINQYVKDDMNSKLKGFNDSDYIDGVPFWQQGPRVKDNKAAADFLISKAAPYYVSMSNHTDDAPTEGGAEVIDNCYSGIKIKDPQKILNTSAVSVSSAIDSVDAAITTLTSMGYTFHGGTHWKPPLGVKPVFADGVRWRPVFTKKMADAGESPPVGCSVLVGDNSGKVMLSKDVHGLVVVEVKGFWLLARVSECKPLPTERDLTTSDLQDIIASQGHLSKANITDQIANLIYDAGYRKSDK